MEQRIAGRDGTTTVVSDTYGFGSMVVGPAEPAEDSRTWRTAKLTEGDVLKRFGWKPEQLETAMMHCGFPQPGFRQKLARFSWNVTRVRDWREQDVDVWASRVRGLGL